MMTLRTAHQPKAEEHLLDAIFPQRSSPASDTSCVPNGMGLNHLPSGRFAANADWLAVAVMAHNLARWTGRLGLGQAS
jgi:hypothetical protein